MNALTEIHKIHKNAKKNRHAVYKSIYKQCIAKIKNDAIINSKQTVFYFNIPIFQLNFPDYDYEKSYVYIKSKLLDQGFQKVEKINVNFNDNIIAITYDPKIEKVLQTSKIQNNIKNNDKNVSFNPKTIIKTFDPNNKIHSLSDLNKSYILDIESDRIEKLKHFVKNKSVKNPVTDSAFNQLQNIKKFSKQYQ
jgi:hypothetical protein